MQQISFCLKELEDIDGHLQEFKNISPQSSAILVTILSGWYDTSKFMALAQKIQQACPKATIVGNSSAGEIWQGKMYEYTTVVHCMILSTTKIQTYSVNFTTTATSDAIPQILDVYKKHSFCAGVGILLANNTSKTHEFLNNFQVLPKDLKLFGGVAALTDGVGSYIFDGEQILHEGAVLIFFFGNNFHIQVNPYQGWHPLGPHFTITKMSETNIIEELNHIPAYKVYEIYLDISRTELQQEKMFFPLLLERNGHTLLRLPASITANGALRLYSDCHVGERVRLAYGDPSDVIGSSLSVGDSVTFKPELIMLFNCLSRRFFLNEAVAQELKPFQNIAPCIGFYTEGEVTRFADGDTSLHNMTLVAVGMCEGTKKQFPPQEKIEKLSKKSLQGPLKLLHHLAHFITVTSQELENANVKLAELASIDQLTGLFNRRAIETFLKKEIQAQKTLKSPMCGIMMDLDNFKHINDKFGHDVGDDVLKWVGKVLHASIRKSDAAGRWGGEEFLILLMGSKLEPAKRVAERIRKSFNAGFRLPNGNEVTCSLGVAEYLQTDSYMDFYKMMDTALYQAKNSGKNRVCSVDEIQRTEKK